MTDDKRSKMLEKVRALLAKANDPAVGEAEAESFRAGADRLMTTYAIEQWQVEAATGTGERPKPEIRKVNIDWWYDTRDSDSAVEIWHMFHRVYRHCRCVIATRGQSYRLMPVIGLPSDLDWADQLFTSLMLQMNRNLVVRADSSKTLAENVYRMRMAGMGWMYITELLWNAGMVEPPRKPVKTGTVTYSRLDANGNRVWLDEPIPDTFTVLPDTDWRKMPGVVKDVIKNRLAQVNRSYAREHGLDRNYVRPDVYQRSFIEGFSSEVRLRLYKMARDTERSYDDEHGSNSMALVVQDIYSQALALYNREFPPPPPPDPNAKPSKTRSVVVREKAKSASARAAGAREGAKANLSNQPSSRLGSDSPRLPR